MDYTSLLIVGCKTTLWEKNADRPAGHTDDIIALDVALVDTTKNIIAEYDSYLVRPKISKVSSYCEKIFGVKQSCLDKDGLPFEEVYRKLLIHYMSRDRLWGSWGMLEKHAIEKQCKALGFKNLLSQNHNNMYHLYSLMVGGPTDNNYISIETAVKNCGITPNVNSAVNIANIFTRMARGLRLPTKSRIIYPGQIDHYCN